MTPLAAAVGATFSAMAERPDGPPPQQVDEGVLKAGRRRRNAPLGGLQQRFKGFRPRLGRQHQAHRPALDDAVAHRRRIQGLGQKCAAVAGKVGDQVAAAAQAFGQFPRGAAVGQFAVLQQQHLIAALRFIQIGGGPDHRHALPSHFPHHRPEFPPAYRVHANAGFIQQQHLGTGHQGAGQAQLLLHAAGQPPGQALDEGRQAGEAQQDGKDGLRFLLAQAAQTGVEAQVLIDGEVLVEAEALRHVAGDAVNRSRLPHWVVASHLQGAAAGRHQPGQHPHEGGLAGTVRTH